MDALTKNIKSAVRTFVLTAGLLFSAASLSASENTVESAGAVKAVADSVSMYERESLFPKSSLSLAFSHFTWGAEAGASLDLTGYDMSTFNVDVLFGYKNDYIKLAGFGAGIHRSVQSGDNFIPVYATIQTSFRKKPSLLFFSAKIGYSFNTISDSPTFGDLSSAMGVGFNLSRSKTAQTHIILSAGYRYFNRRHIDMVDRIDRHYIYIASLSFGVSF